MTGMIESDLASLSGLRSVLAEYKGKIAGTSSRLAGEIEKDSSECRHILGKEKRKQETLKQTLADVSRRHRESADICKSKESALSQAQNEKAAINRALDAVEARSSDDPQEQQAIETERSRLRRELIACQERCRCLDSELSEAKKQENELKLKKDEAAKAVDRQEEKIATMERKLDDIERHGSSVLSSVKDLEGSATDISGRGVSCVNSCIDYLNQYLKA